MRKQSEANNFWQCTLNAVKLLHYKVYLWGIMWSEIFRCEWGWMTRKEEESSPQKDQEEELYAGYCDALLNFGSLLFSLREIYLQSSPPPPFHPQVHKDRVAKVRLCVVSSVGGKIIPTTLVLS